MGDLGFLSDQMVQISIALVVLGAAWLVLRTVLRLTIRIFTIGCSLIVLFGLMAVVYRLFL